MIMKKQVYHHEASHPDHAVRKRASLVADVHPCRQSQCSNLHPSPRLAQSGAISWTDQEICEAFDISRNTSIRVRQLYLEGGLEAVLRDKRQARYRQALAGGQAAHLIAIACSPVPTGHDHWTVRLLAGKAVELGFVESISPETIRQLLKKTNSSPGNTNSGASQP
jgi:hypothetical protein